MKRFALVIMIISSSAYAESYALNGKIGTHDCSKDPDALITGNDNTITFTGACKRIAAAGNKNTLKIASVEELYAPGNDNVVTVDAVGAINTSGNSNTVTWTKGLKEKRPKVANSGNKNKIGTAK
jgi:hypothetical protein